MPDQTDNSREEKKFIRETVESPRMGRKRMRLVRFAILVCCAVLFGVIACLSFVLTKPWMEATFGQEETTAAPIVIPRDETTEAEETEETSEDPMALEREIESMVDDRIDAYLATLEVQVEQESNDVYHRLEDVRAKLETSMVTVTSRSAGEDVFLNSFTRSEQTFGVITAKTDNGLLILTENTLIEDAGVYVTIGNETVDAKVRAVDKSLGMAMVLVEKDALTPETWEQAAAVKFGNSYSSKQGSFVAALGNPLGYTGSALAGCVSYINPLQQGTDLNFQMIQTDMACDQEATGILVDEDGSMIGWITQRYNSDSMAGMLAAISISELKGSIEMLSNGKPNACIGIRYQVVDSKTSEEMEIPEGLYINRCVKNGPASEAGIQNGDILTALDGNSITSDLEFRKFMESKEPEDTIEATVMRQGKGELVEQKYELILTAR